MNLEEIAQQAMDYLDSVGVAADYEIQERRIVIETDAYFFWSDRSSFYELMVKLKESYPQKSPE